MTEATARRIQNFGEQHPDFHSREMRHWRMHWKTCPCAYHDQDGNCTEIPS